MKTRMIIGASIAILAICAGPAEAVLLAYDGFDYEPGELSGENGGFGWDEPWEILGHEVSDDDSSLTYIGNPNSVTGERIGEVWSASCGPYRKLAESAWIDLNDNDTWYVSALMANNSSTQSGPALKLMEGNVLSPEAPGSLQTWNRAWVTAIGAPVILLSAAALP